MQVQTSTYSQPMRPRVLSTAAPHSSPSQDSFTFSGNTGHLAESLGHGLMGAVPVFGAGVNLMSMALTGPDTAGVPFTGAVANGLGTIALATGLFIGNTTVSTVGTGMLGISALTAGWAAYQDK